MTAAAQPDLVDLTGGHTFRFTWHPTSREPVGGIHSHRTVDGGRCEGAVLFDTAPQPLRARSGGAPRPVWHVDQRDPLTLSPSIRCHRCGTHGFVKEGRWHAA